ncbi:MAG: efflux RND transporter periplasmic adaptor subunit [Pseudooceanicola sp.]|nr:efflux RND transporter periplasmic adaptor subunit [Pseudooceanicola sp.]
MAIVRDIGATIAVALTLGSTVRADQPLAVTVVIAETTEVTRRIWLTGEISAPESLRAAFPTGGRITEIAVTDGDRVQAGAELARIDRVQQEQALRATQAQLAAATAELTAAREDEGRQNQLFERGATTRASRNAAADRLAAAVAREAQARAELAQARSALEDTVLLAPSNGTVIERLAEPGQIVGAAQPILELALGNGLDAVFKVPEATLTAGDTSHPPEIRLSRVDHGDRFVTGHIREISPLVDAASGTVQVKVAMDEALPGLSYGDAVRGETRVSDPAAIALPFSSLTATAQGPAVWIVDPGSKAVALRQIGIARYTSDRILVAEGLSEGEIVVGLGSQLLYPGRIVQYESQKP